MKRLFALAVLLFAPFSRGEAASPMSMAAALEARMAAGDGVLLPDPATEIARHAGTVDLARGDWPESFRARAGETICVAVSPFTGDYEFFDESGECFFTLVPVLPTTENWVAPFRHAEEGTHPDDDLYAPWRLVDVWSLTHAEFAESAESSGRARSPSAPPFVARHSSLVTRGAASPATNLCFTAFSITATNLCFTAAWPTNETPPGATLDLYGTTNRCYFTSLLNGNESLLANWSVSPELPDGARLHVGSAPNDPGSTSVSGALSVWLTPGSATNTYTVTATLPFAPDRPANKTFTAIAIDAEPICTETTGEGFVVNPCMVPTGETATFRIKVLPASVPDSDIRWYISGGHAQIQGSSSGREIRVRGTSEGPVHLEVAITGYQGVNPTFDAYVSDMVAVPVDAWIVVGAEGAVVNTTDLTRIIDEANPILRQVCVSCYVHQVLYTNRFDWADLSQCTESEYDDILDEMCAVGNNSSGMEIHFVQRLLTGRLGENDSHGMVLPSTVNGRTFAHETGHAMGLHDIYAFSNDPPLVVSNTCDPNLCPDDWSGNDPRGFYKPPNLHYNIIRRVIMCGDGNPISRDFPAGELYGILNLNGEEPILGWADVGACSGIARRLPHHD